MPFPMYNEVWRDLMVYDCLKDGYGMGLLVITGHHSGTPVVYLPKESGGGHKGAVSAVWLRDNFAEWVYECSIDEVYILDRPESPTNGGR